MKKVFSMFLTILVILGFAMYLPPYINHWPEARARNKSIDVTVVTTNPIKETPNYGQANGTAKPDKSTEQNTKDSKSPTSLLVLVNKKHPLPVNYKPSDLIVPKVRMKPGIQDEKRYLRKEAAAALENLFKAAARDKIQLYHISGFRSYSAQKVLYDYRVKNFGSEYTNSYTAFPGHSEHQTGLAVDVTNREGSDGTLLESFGDSREGKWLASNAYKYGFIIRYPKGKKDITGYNYEPWHIRYVGIKAAGEIKSKKLTLEEYLNK